MYTGWTQADIKRRNCEWDLNPVPLDQVSVAFPLDHSIFLIKLHLTLIITLRMYTGWTQADIKRRNCEWDLNQGRLDQVSVVFPLDHSLFLIKLHLTLIITLRMDTGWTQADIKRRNCEWDLNPVPLDQVSVVFPLDHSLFLIKLHLTLIITLRMYTGWTQADIKRRNCEWDLNPVPLDQESVVFPLEHSLFLIKLHLTLIITLRMYTGWTQADIKRRNCEWDLN